MLKGNTFPCTRIKDTFEDNIVIFEDNIVEIERTIK